MGKKQCPQPIYYRHRTAQRAVRVLLERRGTTTVRGSLAGWLAPFIVLLSFFHPAGLLGDEVASYAPHEILVQFRSGVSDRMARDVHGFVGASEVQRFEHMQVDRVTVPEGWTVEETAELYRFDPDVEYAEPNYYRRASATPDDARFAFQWALNNVAQTGGLQDADVDGPEAWDTTTGGRNVVVAVVDTGIDLDHEDLAANIWHNPGEDWIGNAPGNNGIDDDGNGKIDDYYGWDFANQDNDPDDDSDGHGTHVTGIIGAEGDNGLGVSGINWQASIMSLKILTGLRSGLVSDEIAAIDYAIENGAQVINASFGGPNFSSLEYNAIERAGQAGILFVAAAGNEGTDNDADPVYPASYGLDNLISVAATDSYDALSPTSNYGAHSVDVAAPGVLIFSTSVGNSYAYRSGTSMATPHVAGLAALIWSESPNLSADDVKNRILNGVDRLPNLQGMLVTAGRINADNSLRASSAPSYTPGDGGPQSVPDSHGSSGQGGGGGCFVGVLGAGLSIIN